MTELVDEALHDDDRVDAGDIDVVEDGEVTPTGQVASRRHEHRAEDVASRVSGLHDVENRLRVRRDGDRSGTGGRPGGDEREPVVQPVRGRATAPPLPPATGAAPPADRPRESSDS